MSKGQESEISGSNGESEVEKDQTIESINI